METCTKDSISTNRHISSRDVRDEITLGIVPESWFVKILNSTQ